jgi:hypothetical protein
MNHRVLYEMPKNGNGHRYIFFEEDENGKLSVSDIFEHEDIGSLINWVSEHCEDTDVKIIDIDTDYLLDSSYIRPILTQLYFEAYHN